MKEKGNKEYEAMNFQEIVEKREGARVELKEAIEGTVKVSTKHWLIYALLSAGVPLLPAGEVDDAQFEEAKDILRKIREETERRKGDKT